MNLEQQALSKLLRQDQILLYLAKRMSNLINAVQIRIGVTCQADRILYIWPFRFRHQCETV